MRTHHQVIKKLMRRPAVRAEVERIERDEGVLLDTSPMKDDLVKSIKQHFAGLEVEELPIPKRRAARIAVAPKY